MLVRATSVGIITLYGTEAVSEVTFPVADGPVIVGRRAGSGSLDDRLTENHLQVVLTRSPSPV